MEKTKLIVDTNVINNAYSVGNFLGNMDYLIKLSKTFDIVIPKIVLEEIVKHKTKTLLQQKRDTLKALKQNPIVEQSNISEDIVNSFEITINYEKELAKLPFPVEVIDITNAEKCLETIRELSLNHLAPFDKETDRGLKDAILALSIDDYIEQEKISSLVFVCRDNRLTEYFSGNNQVSCFNNFEELDKIISEAKGFKNNPNDKEKPKALPIVESPQRAYIRSLLSELRNAHNFRQVHEVLSKITKNINNLSQDDFVDTLISATDNDQIYWICDDPDVKEYYSDSFTKYGRLLPDNIFNDFVIKMNFDKSLIRQPRRPEGDDELFES